MIKLFESYKSQRELEKLAKDILYKIATEAYRVFDGGRIKIEWFPYIKLGSVYNDFDELKNFIIAEKNIDICILTNNDLDGTTFSNDSAGKYIDDGNKKMILLRRKDYTLEKINDELKTKHMYKGNPIRAIRDYIYRDYKSTLIHELEHAFDDWRSGGNAFKQQDDKYIKNNKEYNQLKTINFEELKEEEREFIGKHYKEYLNLKHEVAAHFTQAVSNINFYELDFDLSIEQNKNVHSIKPFKEVKRNFQMKFSNFRFLNKKERWRTLRKLGQFYEMEKDFVKELNSKQKEYKSSK